MGMNLIPFPDHSSFPFYFEGFLETGEIE